MKTKKRLAVGAAVIVENGKILITQRLKKSHLGHLWEFPGGKVELGETLPQCIKRECLEEIDVEVEPLYEISQVFHSYPKIDLNLHFYLCKRISGEPKTIECANFNWVTPEELKNYPFPEADLELIKKLQETNIFND